VEMDMRVEERCQRCIHLVSARAANAISFRRLQSFTIIFGRAPSLRTPTTRFRRAVGPLKAASVSAYAIFDSPARAQCPGASRASLALL
jgi:hypothetical protein